MGVRQGQSCQSGCMSPSLRPIQLATGWPSCSSAALEKHALAGLARACAGSQNVHSLLSSFTLTPSPEAMRLFLRNTYRKEVNDLAGIPDQQN